MTSSTIAIASTDNVLPARWAQEFAPRLQPEETLQAWIEIDLDERLQFTSGLVAVTSIACSPVRQAATNGNPGHCKPE